MNVQRFRERSRGGARSAAPTSRSVTAHLNENECNATGVSLDQGTIQPGFFQQMSYTITFQNISAGDTQFDPDVCDAGLFQVGFQVKQSIYVNGELAYERTDCLTSDEEFTASFKAPEEIGPAQVRLVLEGGKSGNKLDEVNRAFEVGDDGGGGGGGGIGESCSPGDCPQGYTCQDNLCVRDKDDDGGGGAILPCIIDPNQECDATQTTLYAVVGVLLMVVVLSAV